VGMRWPPGAAPRERVQGGASRARLERPRDHGISRGGGPREIGEQWRDIGPGRRARWGVSPGWVLAKFGEDIPETYRFPELHTPMIKARCGKRAGFAGGRPGTRRCDSNDISDDPERVCPEGGSYTVK